MPYAPLIRLIAFSATFVLLATNSAWPQRQLQDEFKALEDQVQRSREAYRSGKGDGPALGQALLKFSHRHHGTDEALNALTFMAECQSLATSGLRAEALQELSKSFRDDPRLSWLSGQLDPGVAGNVEFLEQLLKISANDTVQAAAAFDLARMHDSLGQWITGREDAIRRFQTDGHNDALTVAILDARTRIANRQTVEDHRKTTLAYLRRVLTKSGRSYPWTCKHEGDSLHYAFSEQKDEWYSAKAARLLFVAQSLRVGCLAPDIVGIDSNGVALRLSDYRGKVVLLTFTADWCPGCVAMYPAMRELSRQFANQSFAVLSVSADSDVGSLRSSISEKDITWPCWWDGEKGPIAASWAIDGWPSTFLLDREGVIRFTGLRRPEELQRRVGELIQESATKKDRTAGEPSDL